MTPILYQTPVSLSYLAQLILAAGITIVMVIHLRLPNNRVTRSFILTWFMGFLTLFIGLLYLESSSVSTNRLVVSYLENPILAIVVLLMLQFAYRFPTLVIRRRWESMVVLVLTLVYTLIEFSAAVYRLVLLGRGEVIYREPWLDYLLMSFMVWMILVFLYRYLALTTSSTQGLRHKITELLKIYDPAVQLQWKPILSSVFSPQTPEARALRMFIFTAMILPGLTFWNLVSGYNFVSASLGSLGTSLGILLGLFTFSVAYLNYQKEGISFMVKMAETGMVLMLALLACVAWVIAPAFEDQYKVDLPVHQTLKFIPNEFNGYDIQTSPLTFTDNIGINEPLGNSAENSCKSIDFEFPLFGKNYSKVFACKDGLLSLGKPFIYRNFHLNYGSGTPMILPILINLAPDQYPGSVNIQQQADQLIITWMKQHAYYRPEAEFTFQLVLHHSGLFEINYRDIPAARSPLMAYHSDDEFGSAVWAVGVLPETSRGKQAPQLVDLGNNLPLRTGPAGVLQDYSLEFRSHLSKLYFPMSVLVILASILITVGFPFLIFVNLVSPLNSLLRGVKQLDAGNLKVNVPVIYNDEIGFLTEAFNKLAFWLNTL
ncbi:MAG: HAMP domain-containing protein, partial [Chloroflexota bacterium]